MYFACLAKFFVAGTSRNKHRHYLSRKLGNTCFVVNSVGIFGS